MPQTELHFLACVSESTCDFCGREWVFAEIDQWLSIPTGEPGIGKSAVATPRTPVCNPKRG